MAIASLPLSDSFALIWEHDDALDRDRETFAHDYRVAFETLNWEPLIRPGKAPTYFHFRVIKMDVQRRLWDAAIGPMERIETGFRLALTRIDNFPGAPDVARKRHPDLRQYGESASMEIVQHLDDCARAAGVDSPVMALGILALERSKGLSPK